MFKDQQYKRESNAQGKSACAGAITWCILLKLGFLGKKEVRRIKKRTKEGCDVTIRDFRFF